MVIRPSMLRASRASRELRRRRQRAPLGYIQWLPLQDEFLRDDAKRKQMRAGNQAQGKTTAGLAEDIYHALGEHPFYAVPPPPTRGAILCATASQSRGVQEKLWNLLPKDEIDPATEFEPGKGFRGRYPIVKFKNGSIIYVLTAGQDALALSSWTFDWVHFDEPPRYARTYAEMVKRLLRGNPGRAWLTYTPVNAPIEYLRDMVREGKIEDHWRPLTPEAMIPVGSDRPVRLADGTVCDEAWVQSVIADSLPHEVPVVVHGEWEFRVEGNVFRAFRRDGAEAHVTETLPAGEIELQVGIDHGSGTTFSAAAVLVAVRPHPTEPQVWVIDEYVSDGETTIEQDARGILAMLARWGKRWPDLKRAYGDRPWERNELQRKSNKQMLHALERALAREHGTLLPTIGTVKRGKGRGGSRSVHYGAGFLHRAMLRPDGFHVHPRCERLINALGQWSGAEDQWKHIVDALRYSLDNAIFGGLVQTRQPTVYTY